MASDPHRNRSGSPTTASRQVYGAPASPGVGSTRRVPPPAGAPTRTGAPTEEELRALLLRHHGNVAAVGREFGKERMQVHRWMKRYNIDVADYR